MDYKIVTLVEVIKFDDGSTLTSTYVFTHNKASDSVVVTIVNIDAVNIGYGYTHSCNYPKDEANAFYKRLLADGAIVIENKTL